MSWDRLRTFEAIARTGSLTAAGRLLGVSQSTVTRHLAALEKEAGSPVLLRESPVQLTARGQALLTAVRPMVEAATTAQAALEDRTEPLGQVTLTTVSEVIRWMLVQQLPAFYRAHPQLQLCLLADNRVRSLAAGEADLAIRMTRPERGELYARRLHTERYALFVARRRRPRRDTPWLGLSGSLGSIPEQSHAQRIFADRPARLLVEDVEALGLAVKAGLGVAVLPRGLAERLGGLVEVSAEEVGGDAVPSLPDRTFWLVVHGSKRRLPKIRAVMDWLVTSFVES